MRTADKDRQDFADIAFNALFYAPFIYMKGICEMKVILCRVNWQGNRLMQSVLARVSKREKKNQV